MVHAYRNFNFMVNFHEVQTNGHPVCSHVSFIHILTVFNLLFFKVRRPRPTQGYSAEKEEEEVL
jgi:hypothetical protein